MEEDFVEFCNYHDDEDDNKSHFRKQHQHYDKKKEDDDSDDSLASDASSGPSRYQHTHPNGQGSHTTSRSKQDKSYNANKFFLPKNADKKEKKSVKNNTRKNWKSFGVL